MLKIKICGLIRPYDVEIVNAEKPDYIGFVFAKSKRRVTAVQAMELRKMLLPGIIPVGVFVNEPKENIISLTASGVIEMIQLHGNETEDYISKIKSLTGKPVIKAVSVKYKGDVQNWGESSVDYLLLDNKGGGTGECFDWKLIGNILKPYFLAGGISINNISEAINKINPFAVDISSGVETGGFKDKDKIKAIIRRIRNGE